MSGTRLRRLTTLAGALAATALCAAAFAPAAAAAGTTTVKLNSGQRGSTAHDFQNSCDNIPAGDISPGTDGWVFVLPDQKASFVSLHLTFHAGTSTVTVDIPGSSYPNGFATQGADKAWVVLPAGWTLDDGTAQVAAASRDDFFNVTHVCQTGGATRNPSPADSTSPAVDKSPAVSPSPARTTTSPTAGAASSLASSGGSSGAGSGSGSLPTTGAPAAPLVGAGLVLTGAGIVLLLVRRRRAEDTAGPAE